MYDSTRLKSDLAGGIFNGLIFSGCWGLVNGSYYGYNPPLKVNTYLRNIAKYTGNSALFLTPLFVIARITNNYSRESGYNAFQSSLMTFGVCLGVMFLLKNRITL